MGQMNVLGPSGDIVVTWDPDDADSVAQAREEWNRLKHDGYEFYEPVEAKGKRLTKFDPKRSRVIAAPGVQKPAERAKPVGTRKRDRAMAGGPNERLVLKRSLR